MARVCWTFMVIGAIGLVLGLMGAYGVTFMCAALIGLCILQRK